MLQSKDCFSFSASRGSARHFFILLFLVTKRAARFRRVALKKLLSVFAEQPLCLPWHIYIIPHPFAKINTILSKFVQVCPTCAQKHCTRKQISIASGSYPFCAAFFFMLLLAIQLDTDFMIFKAAQLRKSVIRLIFKFTRPFTSTLYPIKRTMSTEFGIMSLQSSTIPFFLINVCKQIIRAVFC